MITTVMALKANDGCNLSIGRWSRKLLQDAMKIDQQFSPASPKIHLF
jgi:hypothetical protein